MIGYISGRFLTADEGTVLVETGGVGYSIMVPARTIQGLQPGSTVEFHVHTNLRENALELFGFGTSWEKRVFHSLIGVSGVGPRTALAIMGSLEAETILSAIVREDRASLTSVSGVGKKTAELLIVQLGEKARKLLAERPGRAESQSSSTPSRNSKRASAQESPAQSASAAALDPADTWSDAIVALTNLGYREADALAAIRAAAGRSEDAQSMSLDRLIMSSLQLLSRGL